MTDLTRRQTLLYGLTVAPVAVLAAPPVVRHGSLMKLLLPRSYGFPEFRGAEMGWQRTSEGPPSLDSNEWRWRKIGEQEAGIYEMARFILEPFEPRVTHLRLPRWGSVMRAGVHVGAAVSLPGRDTSRYVRGGEFQPMSEVRCPLPVPKITPLPASLDAEVAAYATMWRPPSGGC